MGVPFQHRRGVLTRARARLGCLAVAAILAVAAPLDAQAVLDRVLFKFGTEIVTQLDVRQARMLKLVDASNDTDDAYVEAIVNRRLMLAEMRRLAVPEPSDQELEARFTEWQRRVGGGSTAELLERAGMTDAGLRAWLRDDVKLRAYLDERFSGRPADMTRWVGSLRQRAGIR
jgi:hypothetical protein